MARDDRAEAPSTGRFARVRDALPPLPFRRGSGDSSQRVTFTREDARRLNERFALLDRKDRRAIVRAVNRGEGMTKRRDAELAVGVARRQQRFWSRAWLLGPAIALVQVIVTPIGWMEGLFLGAWGALLLGMMAAWWWTRARRAEIINLGRVGGRASSGPQASTKNSVPASERPPRRRSRLPGGRPPTTADDDHDDDDQPEATEDRSTTVARPPRPRGRKRR